MSTTPVSEIADAAAYVRIQRCNEVRLIGKLLHDLRNPIHSVRIAVELFGRIAHEGAAKGLLDKAARYVAPAEAAAQSLARQVERMALLLGRPARPQRHDFALNEWMSDLTALLGGASPPVETSCVSALPDEALVTADKARLGHALLGWALTRAGETCTMRIDAPTDAVHVRLAGPAAASESADVSDEDLRTLLEAAGAQIERIEPGALTIRLARPR